jgi:ribosomal protein S18 acetylase RimI-like enzyme
MPRGDRVTLVLRDYRASDAGAVNRVALAAFQQFRDAYDNWPAMAANVGNMAALALGGEIVVAEINGALAGAVAYIPPHRPKAPYFDLTWPIIRMLVVDPECRGKGLGRALTEECVRRARRDSASVIALHTSPIMAVALSMYLRMGFERLRDASPIYGVRYAVYRKTLAA